MLTRNNRDEYDQKKLREAYLDLKQTGDQAFIAGEFRKALVLYNRALEVAIAVDDNLMSGLILGSIANTYAREGKFEQAMEYYGRATDAIVSIRHRDTIINGEKTDLNERITLRRRSYWAIAFFSISLLALVVGLIFFLSTRNPVILLSLEIPVIFFTLVGGFFFRRVERPHST